MTTAHPTVAEWHGILFMSWFSDRFRFSNEESIQVVFKVDSSLTPMKYFSLNQDTYLKCTYFQVPSVYSDFKYVLCPI